MVARSKLPNRQQLLIVVVHAARGLIGGNETSSVSCRNRLNLSDSFRQLSRAVWCDLTAFLLAGDVPRSRQNLTPHRNLIQITPFPLRRKDNSPVCHTTVEMSPWLNKQKRLLELVTPCSFASRREGCCVSCVQRTQHPGRQREARAVGQSRGSGRRSPQPGSPAPSPGFSPEHSAGSAAAVAAAVRCS